MRTVLFFSMDLLKKLFLTASSGQEVNSKYVFKMLGEWSGHEIMKTCRI